MRLPLSLLVTVAATAFPAAALASTLTLASNPGATFYNGYNQTSGTPSTQASAGVYDVGNGDGVWHAPNAGSTYVSFAANTNPNGSYATSSNYAPNGYYTYTTSFNVNDLADVAGTVSVLADDTVAVFLNTTQIIMAAGGPYPQCAVNQPNCTTPLSAALSGFVNGNNTLTFVVHQANAYATGLDYTASVLTPEPSSLVLLGTGLVGSAGAMLRRFRRA